MDARPQRPLRAVHAQGDENMPPPQAKQTLHQRHKSTGTLNMIGGGLKAAAKRTAFGDVSNTAKTLSAHDDSAIVGKSIQHDFVKPAVPEKTAAFLRPAQRPLNAAGPKIAAASSTTSTTSNPILAPLPVKVPLVDFKSQPAALKRTLSKKSTTVFKDADAEDVQAQVVSEQAAVQASAPVAPVHQQLESHQTESNVDLQLGLPEVQPAQSMEMGNNVPTVMGDNVPAEMGNNVPENLDFQVGSDPIYEDAAEKQVREPEEQCQQFVEGPMNNSDENYQQYADAQVNHSDEQYNQYVGEQDQLARDLVEQYQGNFRDSRQLPALPEPEEYWEDDEDEVYDEQGYTTAHSYRSGGNTTGGVTTVLAPKVTLNVKKELAAAKYAVESVRTMDDVEDEAWDTSMVAEYGDEIFSYMRELENRMLPNANYMDQQSEIQWSMRSVLMDWLIQVHHRFTLLPETLFLCVNYIDRFLSCKIVSLGKLQLVGATAIFVAAKYEEINCPSVSEIVYMVDGGYTVDEILKAERFMLSMLQFELGWPGPMSFLRRISKADDYDVGTRTMAKYFLEVTIMDERFVGCPPSYIAAGAHCLARLAKRMGDWSLAHVYYSGYTWTQLRPLVSMIVDCCQNPHKHHSAVFEKYTDRKFQRCSQAFQVELSRGLRIPPLPSSRPSLPSPEDGAGNAPYSDSFKRMNYR